MTSTTDPEHTYSTYALDIHWASRKAPDTELRHHLETCERCRRYLEHLASIEAEAPPGAIDRLGADAPAKAPNATEHRSEKLAPQRAGRRARWLTAVAAVAGFAAAAGFAVRFAGGPAGEQHGYVGEKGTPAVQALVRSQGKTRVWDGQGPIHPGDAIGLRVACENFRHVTVATLAQVGSGSSWERLSELSCPNDSAPLPFTVVADEEGDSDRLAVVLSRRPVSDSALRSIIEREVRSTDVWVVVLSFPKSKVLP